MSKLHRNLGKTSFQNRFGPGILPFLRVAALILMVGCQGKPTPGSLVTGPHAPSAEAHRKSGQQVNYTLDLQNGFLRSDVEIIADDQKVYHGNPRTNNTIGLASSLQVHARNPCKMRITMAGQPAFEGWISAKKGTFIGINTVGNMIQITQQDRPFVYD